MSSYKQKQKIHSTTFQLDDEDIIRLVLVEMAPRQRPPAFELREGVIRPVNFNYLPERQNRRQNQGKFQKGLFETLFPDMMYYVPIPEDQSVLLLFTNPYPYIRQNYIDALLKYDNSVKKFHITSNIPGVVETIKQKILTVFPPRKSSVRIKRMKTSEKEESESEESEDNFVILSSFKKKNKEKESK
jgi:hypothetical protein